MTTTPIERDIRAKLASMHEATERCIVVTDLMLEQVPHAEVRVALAELADLRLTIAQLVAHTYGGPRPAMSNEAQAILARAAQEQRS